MNKHIGSDFDDFLHEQGMLAEVEAVAVKRVIAFQLQQEMERHQISRSDVAQKMEASDELMKALFDPDDVSVSLGTLELAAWAVGRTLKVELA